MPEFVIDPTKHWNPTGYELERNRVYRYAASAVPDAKGRSYSDAGLACTPDGPKLPARLLFNLARNPPVWMHRFFPPKLRHKVMRLRVLKDRRGRPAHFLSLIGCIGPCAEDDLGKRAWMIGSGGDSTAFDTGELIVFANDWPGDEGRPDLTQPYLNNTGALRLSVEPL
jgi:hypothetical protein